MILACFTRQFGPFTRTDCAPDWYWFGVLPLIVVAYVAVLVVWGRRR